jgi:hypothetical protein
MVHKQYAACAHGIDIIVEDHVRASELTNAAQLSSRGSHSVVLQTQDGNGALAL